MRYDDNIKTDLQEVGFVVGVGAVKAQTACTCLMIGTMSGCCEYGNKLSGSIKCENFPDQLRNW